jgi:hypothetical protein
MDTPPKKVNKWLIGYKKTNSSDDFTVIESPEDHYYADPFIIKHGGTNYLFFEDYDYDKGSIAFGKLTDEGFEYGGKVLEGSHFSFPAVFEHEGEYYMTPENGNIDLYKAKNFPYNWEFVERIATGHYADPVIFKNGKEWLCFASSPDHTLRLFRKGDSWSEIWNCEYANSRSAGHLFYEDGKLLRPVQDCIDGYGLGVYIKEISLAPYTEKVVKKLPDWLHGLTGFHTFNFNEDYTVVDGRIKL